MATRETPSSDASTLILAWPTDSYLIPMCLSITPTGGHPKIFVDPMLDLDGIIIPIRYRIGIIIHIVEGTGRGEWHDR